MRAASIILVLVSACGSTTDVETTDTDTDAAVEEAAFIPAATEYDDIATASRCRVDDDGTNCLEPHERAVRIDDEVRQNWENADFNDELGRLEVRLKPGATLDPRIREGAILYRGRKDRKPMMHGRSGADHRRHLRDPRREHHAV